MRFLIRNVKAFLIGTLTIVLIGITAPIKTAYASLTPAPLYYYSWEYKTLVFLFPIIAGVVVGLIVKKRGWLYGGLVGLVLAIIPILFILYHFYPYLLYNPISKSRALDEFQKALAGQLVIGLIRVLKAAIGGFVGEKLAKKL